MIAFYVLFNNQEENIQLLWKANDWTKDTNYNLKIETPFEALINEDPNIKMYVVEIIYECQ